MCDSELHAGLTDGTFRTDISPKRTNGLSSQGKQPRYCQQENPGSQQNRNAGNGHPLWELPSPDPAIGSPSTVCRGMELGAWQVGVTQSRCCQRKHVTHPAQGTPRAPRGRPGAPRPPQAMRARGAPPLPRAHLGARSLFLKHRRHAGAAAGRQLPPPEVCRAAQHATSCIACMWLFLH